MKVRKRSVSERLLKCAKVMPNGCWEWSGTRNDAGYGRLWINGRSEQAHRVAFRMAKGEIPEGMLVCHKCDNPPCIRPKHLFIGTYKDNLDDMMRKGRGNFASGERNGTKTKPERVARGKRHAFALHPEIIMKGVGHGMHKLTDSEVLFIRKYCAKGGQQVAMARAFAVCKKTIGNIVHRKNWKHLP